MARAYSDDLRRKILGLYERGKLSLAALAERFGVSEGFTKKIRRQQLRTGRMERSPQRYGTRKQATAEVQEQLREMLKRQPDLTLAELQERLYESRRVALSLSGLWRVLGKMGLRLKKSRSTPKNRTRRKTSNVARRGASG